MHAQTITFPPLTAAISSTDFQANDLFFTKEYNNILEKNNLKNFIHTIFFINEKPFNSAFETYAVLKPKLVNVINVIKIGRELSV